MKLYYHKTDGGAEYYCLSPVEGTDNEGDIKSWVLRTDGHEFEINGSALIRENIRLVVN